ncbi:MAG: helix-turn-helix domain-containing protein, partial [Betaproteobacteria bacterium]|nr:helix-turn-helix domain-containing protein [Betaproteobacteria bacterium]
MPRQQYNIGPTELAARLKHKRVGEGLTQQLAAQAAGMTRTTLVAIEQGKRAVKPDELQQLAYLYSTSVNWLLDRDARQVQLSVQFRRHYACPKKQQDQASALLTRLVEAELKMEDILGIATGRKCPINQVPIERRGRPAAITAAQNDAAALRRKLNIGIAPIQDMRQLIEFDLNMRLYLRPLNDRISGMWASAGNYGECV